MNGPPLSSQLRRAVQAQAQRVDAIGAILAELAVLPFTRIIRPAGVTSALAGGASQAAVQIPWPSSGWLVGMAVGTIEGTAAALSALSIRVQDAQGGDVFSDGQAGAFAHAASAITTNGISTAATFRILRAIQQGTPWNVSVKNESAATQATPVVQFFIFAPQDIEQR